MLGEMDDLVPIGEGFWRSVGTASTRANGP